MRLYAVMLVFVLTSYAAAKPNKTAQQKQSTPQPEEPVAVHVEHQEVSTATKEQPQPETPHWYTPIERPEWWLVIIAALTGLAIASQAIETKRATEAMEKSAKYAADNMELFVNKERARLLVTIKYDESSFQFDEIKKIPPLDLVYEIVKLEVAQHGPTKAFNVVGKAKVFFSDSKLPIQPPAPEPMYLPPIIEGTATPLWDAVYIPIQTGAELDAIKNEQFLFISSGRLPTRIFLVDLTELLFVISGKFPRCE